MAENFTAGSHCKERGWSEYVGVYSGPELGSMATCISMFLLLLVIINPKGLLFLHCSISAWQPVNSTGTVLCYVAGLGLDFLAVV